MKATTPHRTSHESNLVRVKRIEGQVRGIQRMIEQREYCIDIVTQIQAAQSALGAVARLVIEKHIDSCVTQALESQSKPELDTKIAELTKLMKRMCR